MSKDDVIREYCEREIARSASRGKCKPHRPSVAELASTEAELYRCRVLRTTNGY